MGGDDKAAQAAAVQFKKGTKLLSLVRFFGLSIEREFWGSKPYDLQLPCCFKDMSAEAVKKRKEEEAHRQQYERIVDQPLSKKPHLPFTKMPRVLQNWKDIGLEPEHVETDTFDLFLDLIFVGVAFKLGGLMKHAFYMCEPGDTGEGHPTEAANFPEDVHSNHHRILAHDNEPECVGLFTGTFYTLVFHVSLLSAWMQDTLFSVRFGNSAYVHRFLDTLGVAFTMGAASAIMDVKEMLSTQQYWFWFLLYLCGINVVWLLRYLHIGMFHHLEHARRNAASDLIDGLGALLLFTSALMLVVNGDQYMLETYVPWLTLIGGLYGICRNLTRRVLLSLLIGRDHVHDCAKRKLKFKHENTVAIHVNLMIQRMSEFSMLMLGETVLQLVVGKWPKGKDGEFVNEAMLYHALCVGAGFCLAYAILVVTISEPAEQDGHALAVFGLKQPKHAKGQSELGAIGWIMVFIFRTAAVMHVGIGVKLVLLDPFADGFFSVEQRIQLSLAMFFCMGFQLCIAPLHMGLRPFLEKRTDMCCGRFCIVLRVCLVIAMPLAATFRLFPYQLLVLQAVLAMAYLTVLHAERFWLPEPEKPEPETRTTRCKELL